MANTENIRNFVITAHIDHGKSTLADRFLEITKTVESYKMKEQHLDSNELERERGITIKMAPVRMVYRPYETLDNKHLTPNQQRQGSSVKGQALDLEYILNLIDTPGHSDFSYEVSRSLKAVEGAILLVDGTQGIQAQTLANLEFAKKAGLTIIGAVNKIDMKPSGIDELVEELAELIHAEPREIHKISGKTGEGVEQLLLDVVKKVPPPKDSENKGALIFSSKYDNHKGVVAYVRIFGGRFSQGEDVKLIATGESFKIKELGYFSPKLMPCDVLLPGEIGYIATGIKETDSIRIGDTIGPVSGGIAMPGFKIPHPVVFVSIYPDDASDYDNLKSAISKLRLNDSSLTFSPDFSEVLGRGFRCGFLGRLHFEITMQRLEREFNLDVINSFPSVSHKVKLSAQSSSSLSESFFPRDHNGYVLIENPKDLPDDYLDVLEPITQIEVLMPKEYLGQFLGLKSAFKISNTETESYGSGSIRVKAKLPLSELISDFDDRLKSVSSGFASFNYEITGFERTDVRRLDIRVADEDVSGLSRIVYAENAESEGRKMVSKLKELLPKVQFSQALQAVVHGRIVARETISALSKRLGDFGKTGGDRTRKMKLWKKQKEGKERLKATGRVRISAEVFKELLKK